MRRFQRPSPARISAGWDAATVRGRWRSGGSMGPVAAGAGGRFAGAAGVGVAGAGGWCGACGGFGIRRSQNGAGTELVNSGGSESADTGPENGRELLLCDSVAILDHLSGKTPIKTVAICHFVAAWQFPTTIQPERTWGRSQSAILRQRGNSRPFSRPDAEKSGRNLLLCGSLAIYDHFLRVGFGFRCQRPSSERIRAGWHRGRGAARDAMMVGTIIHARDEGRAR